MKKFRILSLILVLALSLTACGGGKSSAIQIAVPNDTTNEARALLLLEANGIIKLTEGAGITATCRDIAENPYGVEIVEAEAAQLPNVLRDVDFAIINSNYAMDAGFNPVEDSLAMESTDTPYPNVLCVKEGHDKDEAIQALYTALTSEEIKTFINNTDSGAVVPIF